MNKFSTDSLHSCYANNSLSWQMPTPSFILNKQGFLVLEFGFNDSVIRRFLLSFFFALKKCKSKNDRLDERALFRDRRNNCSASLFNPIIGFLLLISLPQRLSLSITFRLSTLNWFYDPLLFPYLFFLFLEWPSSCTSLYPSTIPLALMPHVFHSMGETFHWWASFWRTTREISTFFDILNMMILL